ncbi:MAG: putative twitching motility protein chemotaxis protein cheW [Pseudomonadota bacterium]
MADREALRDFQRRLADRLQAAPAGGVQASWLAVEAGGGRFLIPLAQAGEIFPEAIVHPVPYTQPWFLGVASLRGALHGVVDLTRLLVAQAGRDALTSPTNPSFASSASGEAQWISFSSALEVQCVLRVDRLSGLRASDAFTASRAPPEGQPDWMGGRHQEAGGTTWQALDLARLSQQPQFLHIGA